MWFAVDFTSICPEFPNSSANESMKGMTAVGEAQDNVRIYQRRHVQACST
jgi:hypothetical protein